VPSGVNNILIINKAVTPGRITAIIVNDRLGFLSPRGRRSRPRVASALLA
jgi:hypothetical protein